MSPNAPPAYRRSAMTVRDDVPAELILPRFLAPGDTAQATLSLDNVAGDRGAYTARIGAGAGLSVAQSQTSIDLARGQREDSAIAISADAEEVSRFSLAVTGPGGFSVDRDYDFQVRSPYLPTTQVERVRLEPGET